MSGHTGSRKIRALPVTNLRNTRAQTIAKMWSKGRGAGKFSIEVPGEIGIGSGYCEQPHSYLADQGLSVMGGSYQHRTSLAVARRG